ncbi:MAG: hypothetical protein H0X12_10630 [Nocardioides sp.]|nr:hypothetical protein [Nocardioides sp.]
MTPQEPAQEAARTAAEAVRALNHLTRPGATQDGGLDVTDVYDLVAELALMAARLPQALRQVEALLDQLVEDHQVLIVDGDQVGDPVAVAVIVGHWLSTSCAAAGQLAHGLDAAQQALTWAAPASS